MSYEERVAVEIDGCALRMLVLFLACRHGLAGHRTSSNGEQFKKPLVVVYYDVDYVKNVKGTNYWRNRYRELLHFSKSHVVVN